MAKEPDLRSVSCAASKCSTRDLCHRYLRHSISPIFSLLSCAASNCSTRDLRHIKISTYNPEVGDEYHAPSDTFPPSAMAPNPLTTGNKILEYTAMAANALHDVASATQIPFLSRICTLTLTIIPMVQVWNSDNFVFCCWISICRTASFKRTDASGL